MFLQKLSKSADLLGVSLLVFAVAETAGALRAWSDFIVVVHTVMIGWDCGRG